MRSARSNLSNLTTIAEATMSFIDLEPAAQRMTELVRGVTPEQLERRTPCTDYTVADLLDHIGGLAEAFTDAARKSTLNREGPPPEGDGSHLDVNWRDRIPEQLDALVHAWREPAALTGMTNAGGIEMPADVAAIVALEELTVHGWDLARATRQPFAADDATLEAVIGFVSQFAGPDQAELRGTAYADPVPVGAEASRLDQAIAMTGRDPGWAGHEPRKSD
jgi:uncharacterized protein (TIGR03086 family)